MTKYRLVYRYQHQHWHDVLQVGAHCLYIKWPESLIRLKL